MRARAKIQTRIKRLQMGNSELRITDDKGYRIYLKNQNGVIVILLCASDKASQENDIKKVKALAKELGV